MVKANAKKSGDLGSIPVFTVDLFPGRVIPVTLELVLHWLPCQGPGQRSDWLAQCQFTLTGKG